MIKYLALHNTAVSREDAPKQFNAVNKYHKDKYGVKASTGYYIGYNDFLDVSGLLTHIRKWGNEETTAIIGHNCDIDEHCDTIHLGIAGNFTVELLNDRQIRRLRKYIDEVKETYPDIEIVFHKDLQQYRTCAGSLFTVEYLHNRILQRDIVELDDDDKIKQQEILRLSRDVQNLSWLIQYLLGKK